MSDDQVQRIKAAALSWSQAGHWEEALHAYSDIFRVAAQQLDVGSLTAAVYESAKIRRIQRRHEEAEELAELSREIAERTDQLQLAARSINEAAVVQYSKGDLPRARSLYAVALERARDIGDDSLIGFVCQNLGVIANIEGNLREARALYLESISASIRDRNEASAMMAYNNLAMVCTDLGDLMESEVYFDRGIEIAERLGNTTYLALLLCNRAEPLVQVEEFARALESLDQAEEIATLIGYQGALVDVARYRARIARLEGNIASAQQYLDRALALSGDGNSVLDRAEALEELAQLRQAQGQEDGARQAMEDALDIYRELGAVRDIARVEELLGQGSAESGITTMEPPPSTAH